jgi:hypothetical protein
MNPILQRLLGGAELVGGAALGSSGLMRAGMNRVGPQGHAVPAPVPGGAPPPEAFGTPPIISPPGAPPVQRPSYTVLPYSTGGGSPRPAFRMPSAGGMYDEMQ